MKKVFLLLVAVMFVSSMMFMNIGCKEEVSEEVVSSEEEAPAEEEAVEEVESAPEEEVQEVVLTIWAGPQTENDQQFWANAIEIFETNNPGVKIDYISTPWDSMIEKYTTAFAAGDTPDLVYSFTGGYVDGVMPMCFDYSEVFTSEEFNFIRKGVADSVLKEAVLGDGKIVGVPYWSAGDAFVYNIDLLEAEGFEKAPDTTEELLEYSKVLTKDLDNDGKIDQYGYGMLSYDTAEAKPEYFLYSYGYTLFNDELDGIGYGDEEAIKAFEYIDQLWNVDKTAVPIGLYPGSTMMDAFFDGKFAMWVVPMYMTANLRDYPDFNLGVSVMPQGPGINLADGRGGYAGSGFWAIPENVDNLELIKEWIMHIYDPEIQKEVCEGYGLISSNVDIEVSADPLMQKFADNFLAHGIPYTFSPYVNELKQSIWDAIAAIQSGNLSPEEAWTQAVENGEAVFE